eukprot:365892-Chlamydomonas_euryale.AAC.6
MKGREAWVRFKDTSKCTSEHGFKDSSVPVNTNLPAAGRADQRDHCTDQGIAIAPIKASPCTDQGVAIELTRASLLHRSRHRHCATHGIAIALLNASPIRRPRQRDYDARGLPPLNDAHTVCTDPCAWPASRAMEGLSSQGCESFPANCAALFPVHCRVLSLYTARCVTACRRYAAAGSARRHASARRRPQQVQQKALTRGPSFPLSAPRPARRASVGSSKPSPAAPPARLGCTRLLQQALARGPFPPPGARTGHGYVLRTHACVWICGVAASTQTKRRSRR